MPSCLMPLEFQWQTGKVVRTNFEAHIRGTGGYAVSWKDVAEIVVTIGAAVTIFDFGYRLFKENWRKGAPAMEVAPRDTSSRRRLFISAFFVIAAWSAVVFNYYDRHFTSTITEFPISKGNARLEIKQWLLVPTEDKKQFFTNVYYGNKGEKPALSESHQFMVVTTIGLLPEKVIDAMFFGLRAQIGLNQEIHTSEIQPGEEDHFYSIPSAENVAGVLFNSWNAGQNIYIFNIIRYRDSTLDVGQYIYTESCVYYYRAVLHYCETGHNRIYIAK